MKQYKQPQAVFAAYYVQLVLTDQTLDPAEIVQLNATAKILAQAYVDSTKSQLTEKSLKGLQRSSEDYIDYGLYRKSFTKTLAQFK